MSYFIWNISACCNLSCVYCWSTAVNLRDHELSSARKQHLVHNLHQQGCKTLVLTGGEPLLADGFWDVLNLCRQLNIATKVLTNGTLLGNHHIERMVEENVQEVHVSLDSADIDENDACRALGTKALESLNRLASYNDKLRVAASVVVMAQRIHQLESVLDLARANKFRVQYQFCSVNENHQLWHEDPRSLDLQERKGLLDTVKNLHRTYKGVLDPTSRAYYIHCRKWLLDNIAPSHPCPAGRSVGVIQPDGVRRVCFQKDISTTSDSDSSCYDLECACFFRNSLI